MAAHAPPCGGWGEKVFIDFIFEMNMAKNYSLHFVMGSAASFSHPFHSNFKNCISIAQAISRETQQQWLISRNAYNSLPCLWVVE